MAKLVVPSYGLHWIEGGIGLLVQQNGYTDVTGIDLGLDVSVEPFTRPIPPCPHKIDLETKVNQQVPDHPLILTSLPIPKEVIKPLYIDDSDENHLLLKSLLRLSSSSSGASILPFWMINEKLFRRLMHTTNLSPLIIYGYKYTSNKIVLLDRLIEMLPEFNRPLIISGDRWQLPGGPPKPVNLDIHHLPLEAIGANYLYERMTNP